MDQEYEIDHGDGQSSIYGVRLHKPYDVPKFAFWMFIPRVHYAKLGGNSHYNFVWFGTRKTKRLKQMAHAYEVSLKIRRSMFAHFVESAPELINIISGTNSFWNLRRCQVLHERTVVVRDGL